MKQTRWAVDETDETGLEIEGRRFSSNDEGGPMMCNLVCSSMGRHVHIDYCRTALNEDNTSTPCEGAELQHIETQMVPNPQRPKDAVTHSLYWRRMSTLVIPSLVLFRAKVRPQALKVMATLIISKFVLRFQIRSIYSRRTGQLY